MSSATNLLVTLAGHRQGVAPLLALLNDCMWQTRASFEAEFVAERGPLCGDDRGREGPTSSPPSELCMRFSRTQLSSRQYPYRDWLAAT